MTGVQTCALPISGVKLTVPAVASGARLDLKIYPSTFTPGPSNADNPVGMLGDVDAKSVTSFSIGWFSNNIQTRSTRLEVGTTYTVIYKQLIFSPYAFSSETTTTITITGKSAAPAVTSATTTVPAVITTTTVPGKTAAVAGVTVTDAKVYVAAPAKVASTSAISVLTPEQDRTMDVVSKTPGVCLPSNDDLVFIDDGKCVAQVVNAKTRKVLRTLKTTVVEDEVSELKVGNEVAVLTPLYFNAGTLDFKTSSKARLDGLAKQIESAGSVLVAGHSGVLMGNTPENVKLARERAQAAVKELRRRGATGPFAIAAVGALDPATTVNTQKAQDKNRRVVIVLIP